MFAFYRIILEQSVTTGTPEGDLLDMVRSLHKYADKFRNKLFVKSKACRFTMYVGVRVRVCVGVWACVRVCVGVCVCIHTYSRHTDT